MTEYDHLIQRAQSKRARDQRLGQARAAIAELMPDEKEELLVELLAAMNSGDAPAESGLPAAATSETGNGHRVWHTKPENHTIKDAIYAAMRDGQSRTAGEIIHATRVIHPWVNEGSIPAALARMVSMEPPMLIKRGKSDRGHPLYVVSSESRTPDAKVAPSP